MKVFYDTEFIEDGKTIELISIGLVRDDGHYYYAEVAEADMSQANDWVKENVIAHLQGGIYRIERENIKKDLIGFLDPIAHGRPELWGYYSAYDHVALCQLYGTMMDLPKDWPTYTRDIKQWCDELGNPDLPKQGKDEHHALADARWNQQAWEFLLDYRQKNAGK